jgi:DNA gyrase subunit B
VLHAGGKFGGEGYKISGGLHGVGASVVNALSSRLDVEIHRDGGKFVQHYAKGGKPQDKLTRVGSSKKHGTIITFWPDASIFEETDFRAQTLVERLREMAFLNKGLEIRFRDERVEPVLAQDFKFNGGISDFVKHLNSSKEPLFKRVIAYTESGDDYEVDVAMQWNTGFYEGIHSFANNIATTEGGMHEEGFKKALTNVVNRYAKAKNFIKEKDPNLLGEDIREGLTAIVSVKLRNPQFEGQTKAKLGNTEMRSLVEKATNEKLADWLEEHPSEARQAVGKANQAAKARVAARQARDLTRRKSLLESSAMPGKLADCSSKDSALCELFIVEGDSAGGPAKRARNPEFQAILPIRGKILNIERARLDRTLKNEEIQALITAVGTGIGEEFDLARLRYHKIVLMTDADVDGSHIRTLLLTFFYRQFPEIVRNGHVYIAQPPLFRADIGKERNYLKDDAALRAFEAEHPNRKIEVSRFKGLGEMDWQELGATTMDPATRSLLQVSVEDAAIADDVFSRLMGDDVESRKGFIQENAKDVRFLDI